MSSQWGLSDVKNSPPSEGEPHPTKGKRMKEKKEKKKTIWGIKSKNTFYLSIKVSITIGGHCLRNVAKWKMKGKILSHSSGGRRGAECGTGISVVCGKMVRGCNNKQ